MTTAKCFPWVVALLLARDTLEFTIWTPPMLSFDFQESKCQNGTFTNLGSVDGASLRRDPSATLFSRGKLGLESLPVPSPDDHALFGSTEPLLEYLQDSSESIADGISISLWLRSLEQDKHVPRPILTMDRSTSNAIGNGITECDLQQIDLQLSVQNRTLTLVFRTSDSFFEPCQTMTFRGVESDRLMHIALVLTHKLQQIYVNGQSGPTMKEPFDPLLSHWSRWGVFQFFSFHDQPSWLGQLYRFEVFSQIWDEEQVAAIMSRGIPPSNPYISDSTFRIYEDAEVVPESHSTEWYEKSNIVDGALGYHDDVPKYSLPISFLDEELVSLLESRSISHAEAPEVLVYITKMPALGKIYLVDGSTLGAKHQFVLLPQREIVFIPDHNTYSALPGSSYATIEYCVSLHEIFTRSHCLSIATIRIIVDPVNDPPIAVIGQKEPYRVREGLEECLTPMKLQGFDVDQGDSITTFEIVSPPQLGYLFLSVPVRRGDTLRHGTLLSEIGYQIPGSEALVEYRYNSSNTTVRDLVVTDSFHFRVRDTHGSWSIPAKVQIQVLSSLTGNSLDPFVMQEGSFGIVPMGMEDQSGLNRSIGVLIETVPQQEGAFLLSQDLKETIPPGALVQEGRLHSPDVDTASGIGFGSYRKLCLAEKIVYASFAYRVVAFEDSGRISSLSDIAERNVTVQCKVKPIQVEIPQDNFTTFAFHSSMDNVCSGYNYNYSNQDGEEVPCESIVIVEGIHVTSDASHTDRALVNLSCTHGRLTLNPQHRGELRLLEDQAVMRRSISFLSLLSDLDGILAHLHYQSDVVGQDEVRIMIEYGNCNDNTTKCDEFECAHAEKSIQIEVLPPLLAKPNMLFDSYPWMPLPLTFTLLLLMKFKGKIRMVLAMNKSNEEIEDERTVVSTVFVRWQQFYDENTGFFYYLDLEDGCVTWSPPLEEDFIPFQDDTDTPCQQNP